MAMSNYCPHWRNLCRITTIEIFSSSSIRTSCNVRHDTVRCLLKDLYRSTLNKGPHNKTNLKQEDTEQYNDKIIKGIIMRCPGASLASILKCFEWEKISDEPIDMSEGVQLLLPNAKPLEVL
ncbi:hypothetical protein Syun_008609 [Stephania yunnanensis]|uniref:Uncharacterized protein n=1 Tax=Stephania yunnanensis TaxID=152371 RepID=A0AAP0KFM1_9MAGN